MPAYGKVKVDTITYDLSGTATDVSVSNIATKASPTFTGTVTVPTPSADDNSTKAASTAYVQTELGDYALKAGPTFTGTVNAADLVLSGDLTVQGTTTTIDTTTLQVEDKNIEIGKVSTPSDVTADGGGWTLKGATDKTFNWVNATDAWTSSEHIHLGDNKKLLFGTGSDLEIYHSGSHSNIKDAGTGQLNFWSNTFQFYNAAGNKTSMKIVEDAQVELYYDNSIKIATTNTGATITGTLVADGLTVDTNTLYVDATNNRVGIGDTSPETPLHVKSDENVLATFESTDADALIEFKDNGTSDTILLGALGNDDLLLRSDAGHIKFHVNNNQEKFRIGSAGQVGIAGANYGTSGQVLTSAGSGSAPSWTTISAAPEITATASGAIPANKIVVVNSNGTVSEGKETITLNNPPTKGSEHQSHSAGADRMDFCFDKTNKQYFIARADFSNVYYHRGEIDANGAFTQLSSGTVENDAFDTCCIYDEEGEVIYFCYHDNASNGQTRMKLYNTANDTLSAESIIFSQWQSAGITDMCGVYEPKYKFVIFQGKAEGSSNKLAIFTMYTDASKTTKNNQGDGYSAGSPSDSDAIGNDNGIAVDNDGHMVSIFTLNSNTFPYYRIKTFTGSPSSNGNVPGTWQSSYAQVNATNEPASRVQVAYDASADKFVFAWRENNGDIKARTGTITGSGSSISLSLGTELTIATGTANGAIKLVADTSINATCIGYMDSNQYLSVNYLTISGTNLTKNSSTLVASSTAAYKYDGASGFPGTFDTFRGRAIFGWINISSQNQTISVLNGTNTTNITTTNVIGTVGSAVSDTATATVQVTGNTNTGQSGLTAGLKYYVQRDGTLASTADPNLGTVEAGIALTSTSLLIKG